MSSTSTPPANHASFTPSIDGMTCGHCVQVVTKELVGVRGVVVRSVGVGSAEITAPDGLTVARTVAAIDEAGYRARVSEALPTRTVCAATGTSCCEGTNQSATRAGCCG